MSATGESDLNQGQFDRQGPLSDPEEAIADHQKGPWLTSDQVRTGLPSWLISLALHMTILIVLGLTLRLGPIPGGTQERVAEVGIALKHLEGEQEFYESESPHTGEGGEADVGNETGASGSGLDGLLSEGPPVDPSESLPSDIRLIGRHALGDDGIPNAGGMSQALPGRKGDLGGKGATSFFGIPADGFKFVYVLDRSGSMGMPGRNILGVAKTQLKASLRTLESNHQFLLVFFPGDVRQPVGRGPLRGLDDLIDSRPKIFNPSGQPGKLALATEENKNRAYRFIDTHLRPMGTTRQYEALRVAISLQPDAIYYLTDAEDPPSEKQLQRISDMAQGITIHAVEIGGIGPRHENNFLARLARRTGGKHFFLDVTKLTPEP